MTEAELDTAIVQVCADLGVITTRANPRLSADTGPASLTGCRPRRGTTGFLVLVSRASLCSPHSNHHDLRTCAERLRSVQLRPAWWCTDRPR